VYPEKASAGGWYADRNEEGDHAKKSTAIFQMRDLQQAYDPISGW
jgi:hypothetical protein